MDGWVGNVTYVTIATRGPKRFFDLDAVRTAATTRPQRRFSVEWGQRGGDEHAIKYGDNYLSDEPHRHRPTPGDDMTADKAASPVPSGSDARQTVVALVVACERMRDRWAEADTEVRVRLWRDVHAAADVAAEAFDVWPLLGESAPDDDFAVPIGTGMRRVPESEEVRFDPATAASLTAQLDANDAARNRGAFELRHHSGRNNTDSPAVAP